MRLCKDTKQPLNEPDEMDYYYKFQKYETDKLTLAEQVRNTNVEYDKLLRDAHVSRETANSSIGKINNDIDALNLLQQSIASGKNLVPKSNAEQHSRFVDYQISCDRYNALIDKQTIAADKAEQLYTAGGISKNEYENAQYELNMTLSEYEQYKNEVQISITQSIESLGRNLDDLQYSLKSANSISASYSHGVIAYSVLSDKSKFALCDPWAGYMSALTGLSQFDSFKWVDKTTDDLYTAYSAINAGYMY